MRKSLFIFLLLTVVIISPLTQVEANETSQNNNGFTQFSWTGSATTVEILGEWNWDERISMIENNGVWIGELNLSKTALGFFSESKKVSNKKLLLDLSYKFIHPDYISGLKNIYEKLESKKISN